MAKTLTKALKALKLLNLLKFGKNIDLNVSKWLNNYRQVTLIYLGESFLPDEEPKVVQSNQP